MALISSKTILTSISLFHLTLAFFFLTNPQAIDDQALVFVLGESMGMPYARGFEAPSPPLAFLAAVLALVGFSDLVSLSMPEEISALYYWGTQAPLRFVVSALILAYAFFSGPSSPLYAPSSTRGRVVHPSAHNPGYHPSTWGGDGLKNRVFFTFIFVEMISWFWTWVTLREERSAVVERARKNRSHHVH